jgi:hypothetical protein
MPTTTRKATQQAIQRIENKRREGQFGSIPLTAAIHEVLGEHGQVNLRGS